MTCNCFCIYFKYVLFYQNTVITVILSVLILHEKITVISIIGTVLILIGLVISQKN
ncbi:EamA family transporter [Anaerostipes sp. MSJ-23]|uniref:EamA family transporter n=1 Tax=Anaerostipes sp. MSJ-23 TaxID=2841520 RepID=UPI001C11E1DF|nr:EamA family transporter [Anaerostipes sp. MSJ-23]MBU5460843.1 EamA family transporter [Anaerostipes sp. MSJ-23]